MLRSQGLTPVDRRAFVRAVVAVLAGVGMVSAQPSGKVWRVALVRGGFPPVDVLDAAFRKGLSDLGYVEGQNLVIHTRYAEGRAERYPAIVAELLALKPDVIVASAFHGVKAAQVATTTVPIVANDLESDPVASGFIKSLARPGGNITGVFLDLPELAGKQLQFLKETVPRLARVAVLWDPSANRVQFEARWWTPATTSQRGQALISIHVTARERRRCQGVKA